MIRLLIEGVLILCAVCIVVLQLAEWLNHDHPRLFVHADYSQCVTVRTGPLLKPRVVQVGNAQTEIS